MFFRYYATYPYYSDAVWYLTQMRRWGQIAEAQAGRVVSSRRRRRCIARTSICRPRSCWSRRRKAKQEDFRGERRLSRADEGFIDGIEYDGRKPNAYLEKFAIGLKGQQKIESGNVVGK